MRKTKKNPADLTLRNHRANLKRIESLTKRLDRLESLYAFKIDRLNKQLKAFLAMADLK